MDEQYRNGFDQLLSEMPEPPTWEQVSAQRTAPATTPAWRRGPLVAVAAFAATVLVVGVSILIVNGDSTPLAPADTGDASEQIEGTWYWPELGLYIKAADDGTVLVSSNTHFSNPLESGTYTFDGETLTVTDDLDSRFCAGTAATWTVEFSDDGDRASVTLVEATCSGAVRNIDGVWLRQTT